jgi:antitoxin component YwqK of YwqJK toxin-antitoxin module
MRTIFLPLLTAVTLVGCNGSTNKHSEIVKESYIHKYGVEVSKEEWNERGKSGRFVVTRKDGVTVSKTYNNGVLEGDTTISFPHNRSIETLQSYHEGNLVRAVNNYASGMPKEELRNTTNQDRILTSWYESGTPRSVETQQGDLLVKGDFYTQDHTIESRITNGKGTRTLRDSYGQLISRDTFSDGLLNTITTYHTNGTPEEVTPYVQNQVHGLKKTFLAGGEPNTIETWIKGVQEGLTTTFRNGDIHSKVEFVAGRANGTERIFEGSSVVEEISWVAGKQHGPKVFHVEDKSNTSWYYNGKLVSKTLFDDMKGNIR